MGLVDDFIVGLAEGFKRSLGHGFPPALSAAAQHYIADGYVVENFTDTSVTLKKEGLLFNSVVTLGMDAAGNVYRIG